MTLVDITRYHVIKICKKYCQRPGPWRHQPIWGPCLVLSQRLKGGLRWFKHQTWGAQYSSHELTPIRGQIAAPCFNDNRFQDVPRPLQRFYMSRFGFKHRTKSPFGILNSAELHKGDVCTESIYETIYITRKVPKWGGVGRKDQIPGIQFLVVMLFCLICLLPKPSDFLAMLSTVLTHPRRFKNAKKSGIPWTTTKLIDSGSHFLTPNFPWPPWLRRGIGAGASVRQGGGKYGGKTGRPRFKYEYPGISWEYIYNII